MTVREMKHAALAEQWTTNIPDAVLRKGTVTIEVSSSASPQLLGFLKGVVDHAD